MIFVEDNFLIYCINDVIVVFLSCRLAFKGSFLIIEKWLFIDLYKESHCINFLLLIGYSLVQNHRLLWHGHQVMYNQIASWMVYGILHDQHDEFFIRR